MKKLKQRYVNSFNQIVSSDETRLKFQTFIFCVLTSVIGLIMFIVNVLTKTTNLMIITGLLTFTSIAMSVLIYATNKRKLASFIISVFSYLMMIVFIIDGGTDGFSPYWVCLVPFISFFVHGTKRGLKIGASMFFVIMILLWTPVSENLKYAYSNAFITRFPIMYAGYLLMAYAVELIRQRTFFKLKETIDKLEEITLIDELTQIENRRGFDKRIHDVWHLFSKKSSCISILIIDIDYFKKYNDFYGHLAGDKIIKKIAEITSTVVQEKNGYVSRWGGEEFIVLLPFYNNKMAIEVAQEILTAVKEEKIPHEKTKINEKILTVSAGVATIQAIKMQKEEQLIQLADESLYEAKNSGRNCIGSGKIL